MNLVQRQIFGNKAIQAPNTFIGGISSTISTPALLATRLGIDVSRITNFSVVGSDIQCRITGGYGIPNGAFDGNTSITYYNDKDNLVNDLGIGALRNCTNLKYIEFKGIISLTGTECLRNTGEIVSLPNCTSIYAGSSLNPSKYLNIQKCAILGTTAGNNGIILDTLHIYCDAYLATNNSGLPDGDLASSNFVSYTANLTLPNTPIFSASAIYDTSFKITDSASASANPINFYELYKNGVFVKTVVNNGFLSGLTASTLYDNYTIVAVDQYYNKSLPSNVVNVTTNTTTYSLLTGLASYYKLDEYFGVVAQDAYKNEHLINDGVTINQSGKIGNSYLSTTTLKKVSTSTAIPITGNFSLNLWVYRTANAQNNSALMEYGSYNTNSGFGFWINSSNQIRWRVNQSIGSFISASYLPLNTWIMLTLVYNGSTIKLYADGIEVQSTSFTTNPNTTGIKKLFLGHDESYVFYGKEDLVLTYNRALNTTEITSLYNSGNGITL